MPPPVAEAIAHDRRRRELLPRFVERVKAISLGEPVLQGARLRSRDRTRWTVRTPKFRGIARALVMDRLAVVQNLHRRLRSRADERTPAIFTAAGFEACRLRK